MFNRAHTAHDCDFVCVRTCEDMEMDNKEHNGSDHPPPPFTSLDTLTHKQTEQTKTGPDTHLSVDPKCVSRRGSRTDRGSNTDWRRQFVCRINRSDSTNPPPSTRPETPPNQPHALRTPGPYFRRVCGRHLHRFSWTAREQCIR